jgi:nitroreductase
MDVLEAIGSRVSAARLREPAPTAEQIDTILKAAVRAPDHGRLSPWRLTVISGAARDKLGQAYVDLRRRLNPDKPDFDPNIEKAKAFRAPTIIAVGVSIDEGHKVPAIEQILAAGAAAQNMLLAAHALGLGAMWKTGELAYDPNTKVLLGLKESDSIIAFLFIGTTEKFRTPPIPDLNGRVKWL